MTSNAVIIITVAAIVTIAIVCESFTMKQGLFPELYNAHLHNPHNHSMRLVLLFHLHPHFRVRKLRHKRMETICPTSHAGLSPKPRKAQLSKLVGSINWGWQGDIEKRRKKQRERIPQ